MYEINEYSAKFSGHPEPKGPKKTEKNLTELDFVYNALKRFLEREPSIKELAKALDCSYKEY